VCGIDRKRYKSACAARCHKVDIAYPGDCKGGKSVGLLSTPSAAAACFQTANRCKHRTPQLKNMASSPCPHLTCFYCLPPAAADPSLPLHVSYRPQSAQLARTAGSHTARTAPSTAPQPSPTAASQSAITSRSLSPCCMPGCAWTSAASVTRLWSVLCAARGGRTRTAAMPAAMRRTRVSAAQVAAAQVGDCC
jgi:hypothetical protein